MVDFYWSSSFIAWSGSSCSGDLSPLLDSSSEETFVIQVNTFIVEGNEATPYSPIIVAIPISSSDVMVFISTTRFTNWFKLIHYEDVMNNCSFF